VTGLVFKYYNEYENYLLIFDFYVFTTMIMFKNIIRNIIQKPYNQNVFIFLKSHFTININQIPYFFLLYLRVKSSFYIFLDLFAPCE